MHPYIPHTPEDREAMLSAVGAASADELYRDIPPAAVQKESALPPGLSEWETSRRIEDLAGKNSSARLVCFRGGGVYDHYVPALVDSVVSRSEFYTAYTPYQPEISQGTLQYIFEYQSMIAELTGMDTVNASLYDGATAAAEAMIMAMHAARRPKVLVSGTINPGVRRVLDTYARFHGVVLETVPMKDGVTDGDTLGKMCDGDTAALLVQSPNYFGLIEDTAALAESVHGNKGLFVQIADPLSLALLKSPGEAGADIAVGEAQPLGLSLNYGGPYLGFIGTTKKLMRKLPGRICGQTLDRDGKRAFVLTLQAREQHIRREKATSNICSNQSLCSLSAAVYMATMGKEGLKDAAGQSLRKARYVLKELEKTGKWEAVFPGPFFREFLVRPKNGDKSALEKLDMKLEEEGILGGMAPEGYDSPARLISVTEKRSREEMDRLVKIMGEAL
ncbi:MAG: aminomethyl-transferring glycine dehydrogenase subunit GcvPA [Spirochaetales bacterium]|nr:aminomethyl-transferring glycine dehydrogenase subunit GcvPA [Spirochaetales bacterium]